VRLGGFERRLISCALLLVQRSNSASAGDKSRTSALRLQRLSVPTELAVALPRMLAQIEADLATAGPARRRLGQRAELVRGLLTPRSKDPARDLLAC
jgi:hypothetical protein